MLHEMLNCCEIELKWLDMRINAKKSACIRFGPCYDTDCFQILTASGDIIEWVDSIWYLGVYFVSGRIDRAGSVNSELHNSELKEEYESIRHNLFWRSF